MSNPNPIKLQSDRYLYVTVIRGKIIYLKIGNFTPNYSNKLEWAILCVGWLVYVLGIRIISYNFRNFAKSFYMIWKGQGFSKF